MNLVLALIIVVFTGILIGLILIAIYESFKKNEFKNKVMAALAK